MPVPSRRSETLGIRARLLGSSLAFALAVALALGAAHVYEPPRSAGADSGSTWLEPDFLYSLASSALALGLGWWSRRAATAAGATAARSLATRVLIWIGLTLLLFGVWVEHVFLFTLFIAPTHAFACLRLLGLWSSWRADVAFRRDR